MNTLRIIRDQDVGLPPTPEFRTKKERHAARAVMLMGQKVALMFFSVDGYHKLPGGGIEDFEDSVDAVKREVLEETGSKIRIIDELGQIIEERGEEGFLQISEGFLVEQQGDIGEPRLSKKELAAGAEVFWADDIDQAIQLVEGNPNDNEDNLFRRTRDSEFLKEAKKKLSHLSD